MWRPNTFTPEAQFPKNTLCVAGSGSSGGGFAHSQQQMQLEGTQHLRVSQRQAVEGAGGYGAK